LDGALVDPVFVDIDGLVGLNGASQNVWDALVAPNGELWVSNYSAQRVHRFSADGQTYLGDLPLTVGIVIALEVLGAQLWISSLGGAHAYDTSFTQTAFVSGSDFVDVHAFEGDVLICRSNGWIDRVDVTSGAELAFASPGGSCEQAFTRVNGGLLVANATHAGYCVLDRNGGVVATHYTLGVGSINGVAELRDGRVLLNGTNGVYRYDPATGGVVQLSAGAGAFIGVRRGGLESTSTCASNPSSTGSVAVLVGAGSNVVANNDVRLIATSMPLNAFGYFLASRTAGSVANPGGSRGVLCLGGSIGRYVGPGQILNSGAGGSISLQLDLTSMPQPTGPVAVVTGETWHFQAWFRDAVGGSATSNFTNGLTAAFL
jgi:hypothetical protein